MPFLLRKVKRTRWVRQEEYSWLPEGEPVSDALADLNTTRGTLSFYRVDDNRSNLDDVILGLASNLECIDKFDYLLVPESELAEFKRRDTPGHTPCASANTHHVTLEELSPLALVSLARTLYRHGDTTRQNAREVGALIVDAYRRGRLVGVKKKLLEALALNQ